MSLIASAYKIDDEPLAKASILICRSEYNKFWNFMKTYEVATLAYSGSILAAAIPFVEQRGISFPKREDLSIGSITDRKTIGLIALGNAADYASAAKGLASLSATDEELRQYYMQLYGDNWEEAASAMREALSFLGRAVKALESSQDLLLITIH